VADRQTAIVTGAAKGIGAACAGSLASRGITVVGVDRDPAPEGSAAIGWVEGDVADGATWDEALARCREMGGAPTILVSNAATVIVGDVLSLRADDWARTLNVNLFGAIKGVRACLPGMLEAGKGSIVTVASVDAFMAEQGLIAYCTSKGALLQFTRVLAMDYARQGIRANCVCPGATDTPLFRFHVEHAADPENFLRARQQRNPLGRLLEPAEVGEVVAFLASDASSGMTGATVTVDAGLSVSFDYRTGAEGA
jgi:NAD(P)-dependent dehydrogenase (short-subunit alcohol dehydrogenase family)